MGWVSFTFCLFHQNINSFYNKYFDFLNIFNSNWFDLILSQESKIDSSVPDSYFDLPNYRLIRRDCTAHGGGIIIFVKKSLIITNIFIYETLEAISFSLNLNNQIVNFIYSYNQNFNNSNNFFSEIEKIILNKKFLKNTLFLVDINQDLLSSKEIILISSLLFHSFDSEWNGLAMLKIKDWSCCNAFEKSKSQRSL